MPIVPDTPLHIHLNQSTWQRVNKGPHGLGALWVDDIRGQPLSQSNGMSHCSIMDLVLPVLDDLLVGLFVLLLRLLELDAVDFYAVQRRRERVIEAEHIPVLHLAALGDKFFSVFNCTRYDPGGI